MLKKRSFLKWLGLSIVTLGIYHLYWVHKLAKDVNKLCAGDGKKTSGVLQHILFGILTFGIYDFVWFYMVADRIEDAAPKYGFKVKESPFLVLLALIFLSPVAVYIITKNMNDLVDEYNKKPLEVRAQEALERNLLSQAKRNKGILSPAETSLQGNISIDDAKKTLDDLVLKGVAEIHVRKDGVMVYTVPEMMEGDNSSLIEDF